MLTDEDQKWLDMAPVGREFGSPEWEMLEQRDLAMRTSRELPFSSTGTVLQNHVETLGSGKSKPDADSRKAL